MPFEIIMQSTHDLFSVAKTILKSCAERKVYAFLGEMGSGKTTLIKAMCQQLGTVDQVSSPTFAIANEYSGKEKIYHLDLYRLENIYEAIDIGVEEYIESGNYCFIEWAELVLPLLPSEAVTVRLTEGKNNERLVQVNC